MAPRVSNEQLLEAIRNQGLNGEGKELKALLPQLRIVAGLSEAVPALHRLAEHVEEIVGHAQASEDNSTTWRTIKRWVRWERGTRFVVATLFLAITSGLGIALFANLHWP